MGPLIYFFTFNLLVTVLRFNDTDPQQHMCLAPSASRAKDQSHDATKVLYLTAGTFGDLETFFMNTFHDVENEQFVHSEFGDASNFAPRINKILVPHDDASNSPELCFKGMWNLFQIVHAQCNFTCS